MGAKGMMRKKGHYWCDECEENVAAFKVSVTDMGGLVIDTAELCEECIKYAGFTIRKPAPPRIVSNIVESSD